MNSGLELFISGANMFISKDLVFLINLIILSVLSRSEDKFDAINSDV